MYRLTLVTGGNHVFNKTKPLTHTLQMALVFKYILLLWYFNSLNMSELSPIYKSSTICYYIHIYANINLTLTITTCHRCVKILMAYVPYHSLTNTSVNKPENFRSTITTCWFYKADAFHIVDGSAWQMTILNLQ